MTPDQEKNVLQALYDRLFQAVTYTPSGSPSAFDPATTLVQFTKNEAINPDDFKNAVAPTNPNGSLGSAETFARMVDVSPQVQADFVPRASPLSAVYKQIVNGANTSLQTNPEQAGIYQKAFDYLNTKTTITDFTGASVTQYSDSQIYATYKRNQTAYATALFAYRTAYNNYDLTVPAQQRQWQANEPLLSNALQQTYQTWRSQGATQVEQALNALASSINNAVSSTINAAQQAIATPMASQLGAVGSPWYMTYALPTNWYDDSASANFSQLQLDSDNLQTSSSSQSTSYGAGASWGAGLWSIGGGVQGSSSSQNFHMDAQKISLSASIGLVRITRPWLFDFLFRMNGWYVDGQPQNGISNGKLLGNSAGLLPLIPTAFVVATNIVIKANFSAQEQAMVQKALSTSASVGWGPFSIGGNYSHSSSDATFKSTLDNGSLQVPGIQIIAWVGEIVPASPPLASPASH